MYEIIIAVLGIIGSLFGIYSLILQLRDRCRIDPKIQQTFVRITSNFDYLIQVTLVNLGGRVAKNCMARIFEDENPLADLSHMPIDSPLGRISPDWPVYSVFNIFPKTPIIVRGYLDSNLKGHRVFIQLFYNDKVRDRSSKFTLPYSPDFSQVLPYSPDIPQVVEQPVDVDEIGLPEPSYPSDRWEFLWFKYTGDNEDPWGDFINRSIKYEINFDDDWGLGEVDNTGEANKVGFIASRSIQIFESGETKFTFGSDDGIRFAVYDINFREIFKRTEYWKDQTYDKPHYHTQFLPVGEYKIKLEWYENTVYARVIFKIDKLESRAVEWHLSGAVMPVPPYGSIDIPNSDSASELIVQQLEEEGNVKIICDMRGLRPNARYRVAVGKVYTPHSTWPGSFSDTIHPISFVTDSAGCGKREFNLRSSDFPNLGVHTLSVWLNALDPNYTILISDNFLVSVRS